jgi:hypothetical protein
MKIIINITGKEAKKVNDLEELFNEIVENYINDNELVFGEFMANIMLQGINLEETEELIKRLRTYIDGEE